MTDSTRHCADKVVEAVIGSGVDKAVFNPFARSNSLVDFGNKLEGIFDTFVAQVASVVNKVDVFIP